MTQPDIVAFTVEGLPIAKGRARAFRVGNFIRHHTPKKTENYEAWVRGCALAAMGARSPIEAPCRMVIEFALPVPTSWPQWKKEAALEGEVKPTGRPDLDNLTKTVKDACNGIVFKDDSQVCELDAYKIFSKTPHAWVKVVPQSVIASAAEWKERQRRQAFVSGMTC